MKREIAKGAAWMIFARWTLRAIGIISTLVLARLLSPEDFGLVAMAMTVVTMIELMSWLGLEAALIKHNNPDKEHYHTAWSLRVLVLLLCAAITALAAVPTAIFFKDPRLTAVMLVISVVWALQSLENIGTVDFRRNMQFDREFLFLTAKKFVGFVVCLLAAFMWRSYWALVAGIVASRIAGLIVSYTMHPMRPRWSLLHWREMLSFSRSTLANAVLEFAGSRIPHLFVGRTAGPAALGTYAIAEEISYLPATEVVDPIGRTLFPAYSRLVTDRENLTKYVMFVNASVLSIALPACIGIALVAAPVVLLALGPKWVNAIPIMQVLALSAACMAIRSNSWALYFALGFPHFTTRLWIVKVTALLLLIYPLYERFGLVGVAYADLVATVIMLIVDIGMLLRVLGVSIATYLRVIMRPIMASVVMALVVSVASEITLGPTVMPGLALDHLLRLAFEATLGAGVYAAVIAILWQVSGRPDGVEKQLLQRTRVLLKARPR